MQKLKNLSNFLKVTFLSVRRLPYKFLSMLQSRTCHLILFIKFSELFIEDTEKDMTKYEEVEERYKK